MIPRRGGWRNNSGCSFIMNYSPSYQDVIKSSPGVKQKSRSDRNMRGCSKLHREFNTHTSLSTGCVRRPLSTVSDASPFEGSSHSTRTVLYIHFYLNKYTFTVCEPKHTVKAPLIYTVANRDDSHDFVSGFLWYTCLGLTIISESQNTSFTHHRWSTIDRANSWLNSHEKSDMRKMRKHWYSWFCGTEKCWEANAHIW